MSSGNGTGKRGLIERAFAQTAESNRIAQGRGYTPIPLKAAEMSAQQRNATLDDLIETVNTNAKALAELRGRCEAINAHAETLRRSIVEEREATFIRHWQFVGRTFWQRLRWLLTGR
jgi:phage portal protein BeeE